MLNKFFDAGGKIKVLILTEEGDLAGKAVDVRQAFYLIDQLLPNKNQMRKAVSLVVTKKKRKKQIL